MVMEQHKSLASLDETQIRQLLDIANLVNSNLELTVVLQTIVETICQNTNWPMASIATVDENMQEVHFVAQKGFKDSTSTEDMRWSMDVSLTPRSIKTGKTIVVHDVAGLMDYPLVREYSLQYGHQSLMIVPLLNVQPATALWLCAGSPTDFTQNDVIFAEALAHQTAIAFRNAMLYQQSRNQAEQLSKINQTISELLNVVVEKFAKDTPEEIIALTSRKIDHPIWFEDQSGKRIPDGGGPDIPTSDVDGTSIFDFKHNGGHALAIPVTSGAERFGWLLTCSPDKPFTESEVSLLRQLALVFSLLFLKERVRHEVESQLRTDLFSSILTAIDADHNDQAILTQRSRALNIELPQPARVAILDVRIPSSVMTLQDRDKLARAVTSVSRWLPNRLVSIQDQYIALLIKPGEENDIAKRMLQLQFFFPKALPVLALGEKADSLADYKNSLTSAFKVLKASRFLKLKKSVIKSEDLGIYEILFDPGRQGDLERHAHHVLGELKKNDPKGVYWETLDMFFEKNCHLETTARALNIHISTLRYRLDKIQSLFNINWKNPDERLNVHIAIVIEQWRRVE